VGRTQLGNNNTYCQDNELSWFDWGLVEAGAELLEFARGLIGFRHAHPVLRGTEHPRGVDSVGSGLPEVSWHGVRAWQPDWAEHSRVLGMLRCGGHAKGGTAPDDDVYVAVNTHWEAHDLELPEGRPGHVWHLFADTAAGAPHPLGEEPVLELPGRYRLDAHSVVILVGRPGPAG
jgi:glycogen operon protein